MRNIFAITYLPDRAKNKLYICSVDEENNYTIWGSYNIRQDRITLKGFTREDNPITNLVLKIIRDYLHQEEILQKGIKFEVKEQKDVSHAESKE